MITKSQLLWVCYNALLFNVTQYLRFLYVHLEDDILTITVVLDREPTEDEKDVYYSYSAEVEGHFAELDDSKSKVVFVTEDFSESNYSKHHVVFARCDYLDDNGNLIE